MLGPAVRTVVLSVALAAAGGQRSFAQERWYQAYTEGLNAFQKQQWDLAEQKFKAALAANPQQGRRVFFYGTRRDDYLPEYYLAQIYLRTGRDAAAAPLLDRMAKSGFIKKGDREFDDFSTLSAQAARAVAPPNPAANGAPTNAGSQAAQQRPPVNQTANPPTVVDLNANPANANPSNANAAPNPAGGAAAVNAAANPNPPAAANPTGRGVTAPAVTGGGSTVTPPPVVRPTPPATRDARAPASPVTPPAATVAELERRALGAFYRGEYPAAMSLLESADYQRLATSDLSRRKRLFYLACSGAAVALTQGGAADRLVQARAQFGDAQGDGPQFAEDRRYISPRILNALVSPRR